MLNAPEMHAEKTILTVRQLNQTTRSILEKTFGRVWIKGELSNVSLPASGHMYFTLKDEAAQVRCAFFKNNRRANGLKPKDGMAVLVQAEVSLYEPRGDYQLIVSHMEEWGLGTLQQAFEALKAKLQQEGLFAPEHKKELPNFPRHIGVVTSHSGAALQDILSVLKRRYPLAPITLYATQVQGKTAAADIARAIALANEHNKAEVLIVARGGGSLEDLWCFNEEIVARSIFKSVIPIVTGVGHEVDFTIADFVADHRAPTPSVAAETITPDIIALQALLQQYSQDLTHTIKRKIQSFSQRVDYLEKCLKHPGQILKEKLQHTDHLLKRLVLLMQHRLTHQKQKLAYLAGKLDTLSPLATLGRGYAIVQDEAGSVVQSTKQVKIGQSLRTRVKEGEWVSTVKQIIS